MLNHNRPHRVKDGDEDVASIILVPCISSNSLTLSCFLFIYLFIVFYLNFSFHFSHADGQRDRSVGWFMRLNSRVSFQNTSLSVSVGNRKQQSNVPQP